MSIVYTLQTFETNNTEIYPTLGRTKYRNGRKI